MWHILHRNPRAFLWALLLHLSLAVVLFAGIDWPLRDQPLGATEQQIEASLTLSSEQRDRVAQLRDPEGFAAAQEAERHRAAEQARRLAAAAEAERQRQAEAERQRQAAEEAQRQARLEAQRQAKLQAQREAEAQARREAEQQARREAEAQAQREAEEQARREAEAQARRTAAEAARVQRLASEWVPRIQSRVAQFWIRPKRLQVQASTLVALKLNPGGTVVPDSLRVLESSGYPAFDAAVIRAIKDASPLPVPDGQDFELFEEFNFRFSP
jgi:colicin import membrane protein